MQIETIQAAVAFKQQDDILYLLGRDIIDLQKRYKAQKQMVSLPEPSSPEIPRITLFAPNFIINIALSRVDIMATIPPNLSSDPAASLRFIGETAKEVYSLLLRNKVEYQWVGIVVNSFFTKMGITNSHLEAVTPVYDSIINIPRGNKRLASFNFQFGFQDTPFNINYTIGSYEKINIVFPNNVTGPEQKNANQGKNNELADTGVSVIIDVNNKLKEKNNGVNFGEDLEKVSAKCGELAASVINDLRLSSVLP